MAPDATGRRAGVEKGIACHCEERSDEAISAPGLRLPRFARNDGLESARATVF
jgi:hypothetical protein